MEELKNILKDLIETLEKLLNSLISIEDFSLESIQMDVHEYETLFGERNIAIDVIVSLKAKDESGSFEYIESLLKEIKQYAVGATAEIPTVTLKINLKSISLPTVKKE